MLCFNQFRVVLEAFFPAVLSSVTSREELHAAAALAVHVLSAPVELPLLSGPSIHIINL